MHTHTLLAVVSSSSSSNTVTTCVLTNNNSSSSGGNTGEEKSLSKLQKMRPLRKSRQILMSLKFAVAGRVCVGVCERSRACVCEKFKSI